MLRQRKKLELSSTESLDDPTREWLREQLAELGNVLSEPSSAAAEALWNLVGGEIVVEAHDRPGKDSKFLRGTFRINAMSAVTASTSKALKVVAQTAFSV